MTQKQFSAAQVKQGKGDPQTPRQAPLTGPTYKMPKRIKALLATFAEPHLQGHYRRMMLDAHVTAIKHAAESAKKKSKEKDLTQLL